jgi:pimeloyl-ACP methyl ester carboxylesterase
VKPVVTTATLVTQDGVPIDTVHLPGRQELAIVMAHGFTQSWQRPMVWKIAQRFSLAAGVVTFDFRGHGRSGGLSTLGDSEIYDLDVAVQYARELGYERVATVGFSMGGSVVLRQAGLRRGVDAVVSVSGPGRWYYRETVPMRKVHFVAEKRVGRLFAKQFLQTRIASGGWDPEPVPPAEAAARISPVPLLIVHGDKDAFFPLEHGRQLYASAREPKELWLLPGFGHAERATDDALTDRIAAWVTHAVSSAVRPQPAELETRAGEDALSDDREAGEPADTTATGAASAASGATS